MRASPRSHSIASFVSLVIFACGISLASSYPVQAKEPGGASKAQTARSSEIVVSGKVFCSLKRQVAMPFPGTVISLNVRPGQRVKAGDMLASFRLAPEQALQLRRRVSPTQINDLQLQLAGVEKGLEQLEAKQRELRQLIRQELASAESITQVEREMQYLTKQRASLQERLRLEQGLVQEDLAVLKKSLGNGVALGQVPHEIAVTSPIAGHVIWVNPDFREAAEFPQGAPVIAVGVMDPMRLRALVHEIEALQLKPGDVAEFSTESIPGRKFQAKVVSIPWTSSTPALDQPSYYEVELQVQNPDSALKEGLKGEVVFPKSP
jgi:multidrug efflux pump subunit AcrA (membrane-fusion protein)